MRNAMKILAAGMLCVCLASQDSARARPPDSVGSSAVSFREASAKPIEGYKLMSSPEGEKYYVSQEVLFTGNHVTDIQLHRPDPGQPDPGQPDPGQLDPSNVILKLILNETGAAALAGAGHGTGLDRLAIVTHHRLLAAPKARVPSLAVEPCVLLEGLSLKRAEHLTNLLAKTGAGADAAIVSVVPVESTVASGGALVADVYIANVRDLRGYQMKVVATGARSGHLAVDDITIDRKRPDYVFGSAQTFDAVDLKQSRILGALAEGSVNIGSTAKYLGTYRFQLPAGAGDAYYVNVIAGRDSLLRDSKMSPIRFELGGGALISSLAPSPAPSVRPSGKR